MIVDDHRGGRHHLCWMDVEMEVNAALLEGRRGFPLLSPFVLLFPGVTQSIPWRKPCVVSRSWCILQDFRSLPLCVCHHSDNKPFQIYRTYCHVQFLAVEDLKHLKGFGT